MRYGLKTAIIIEVIHVILHHEQEKTSNFLRNIFKQNHPKPEEKTMPYPNERKVSTQTDNKDQLKPTS